MIPSVLDHDKSDVMLCECPERLFGIIFPGLSIIRFVLNTGTVYATMVLAVALSYFHVGWRTPTVL